MGTSSSDSAAGGPDSGSSVKGSDSPSVSTAGGSDADTEPVPMTDMHSAKASSTARIRMPVFLFPFIPILSESLPALQILTFCSS